MTDKCEPKFITEEEAMACGPNTLDDIRSRIEKETEKRERDDDRPRGSMKECAYTIGCSKGWTDRGLLYGLRGSCYQEAKALAAVHKAETGHNSGVIFFRCTSIE